MQSQSEQQQQKNKQQLLSLKAGDVHPGTADVKPRKSDLGKHAGAASTRPPGAGGKPSEQATTRPSKPKELQKMNLKCTTALGAKLTAAGAPVKPAKSRALGSVAHPGGSNYHKKSALGDEARLAGPGGIRPPHPIAASGKPRHGAPPVSTPHGPSQVAGLKHKAGKEVPLKMLAVGGGESNNSSTQDVNLAGMLILQPADCFED
jgi:hypothetical protein